MSAQDTAGASVITVRGPVPVAALGLTDAHSHLWIGPVAGADPAAPVLTDEDLLTTGLRAFAASGGGAIVDCQPPACGRDAGKLVQLSQSSGVHIVACTGFHLRRYYSPDATLWRMTATQACDFFVAEIRQGLAEAGDGEQAVHPGVIKVAAEASLERTPRFLLEAAAEASRLTGLAIEMHTEQGAGVDPLLMFLLDQGVEADQLVFCHVDKRPDFGLHRALAQAGVMLEYDTFFRPKYEPDRHAWPLVAQMLAAGLGDRLALATDMADPALWRDPGPAAFVQALRARLVAQGASTGEIARLLGGNIVARLACQTID